MIKFHGAHIKKEVPMAIIPQKQLFGWNDITELGDLERFSSIIKYLPDEELMITLENHRGKGRDDYPIRPVWNSILAGIIFEHESIESLRRELQRNGQLREICGFDLCKGIKAVPKDYIYSRFLRLLFKYYDLVQKMFDRLVKDLTSLLPDLGKTLAIDGKAIQSYAKRKGNHEEDMRGEHDADWGVHEYKGTDKKGKTWKKVKRWFGFTLHLVVDAKYELPVSFTVTKASKNEMPVAHMLLSRLKQENEEIVDRCEYWLSDKGQDDGKMIKKLWDEHKIKSVIDIRNMWKDCDKTRLVEGQENVIYNWKGTVYCMCPAENKMREMAYGGFEEKRGTLKYKCPAINYGFECTGKKKCNVKSSIRIPITKDRRIFTPVARSSYKWKRIYNMRTAVERVNSRIDNVFKFEKHKLRGIKKISLKLLLSFCMLLSLTKSRIENEQEEKMIQFLKAG